MWFWLTGQALAAQLWTSPQLDNPASQKSLSAIFSEIEGAHLEQISFIHRQLCFSGTPNHTELLSILRLRGFEITSQTKKESCSAFPIHHWSKAQGDVQIVSSGEEFNPKEHLSPNKYTLFDFGARLSFFAGSF